jgi:hypothetical protein
MLACNIYKASSRIRHGGRFTRRSAFAGKSLQSVSPVAHPLLLRNDRGGDMRFASLFLVGYAVFLAGVAAALWKLGVLERVGAEWTGIGFLIAAGIGVMLAIGGRRAIEIDRS